MLVTGYQKTLKCFVHMLIIENLDEMQVNFFLMEGEGIETNSQEALFLGRVKMDPQTVNSIKKHQCKRKGEYTT